jgi:vitamin B12/bleomycin/antimicrobial peptide transport system ATP-binding/permease protein
VLRRLPHSTHEIALAIRNAAAAANPPVPRPIPRPRCAPGAPRSGQQCWRASSLDTAFGWLADRIFYRLRFSGKTDNPDQRISEDVRIFTEQTVYLAFGLLDSLVTLASFAAILWRLSGSITLPIAGLEITIPGYMFWVAVLYSGVGSALAHLIGRPLIRLTNRQQNVEADFRFSLVRLREEAESIALYGGEEQERGRNGRRRRVH